MLRDYRALIAGVVVGSLFTSISACSQSNSSQDGPSQPENRDSTASLTSQLAGTRLDSGTTSIEFGSDNTFELLFSPEIMAPEQQSPLTAAYANCHLKISGTFAYYSMFVSPESGGSVTETPNDLQLTLSEVSVLSSSTTSGAASEPASDPSATPAEICQGYAQALMTKHLLSLPGTEYSASYLSTPDFNLDISRGTHTRTMYDFIYATRVDLADGLGTDHRYFVKSGVEVDVSAEVLADIGGISMALDGTDTHIQLTVTSAQKDLQVTNPSCGANYVFDIDRIYVEGGFLRMHATAVEAFQASPTPSPESPSVETPKDCDLFKTLMSDISGEGIGFNYLAHICGSQSDQVCNRVILAISSVQDQTAQGQTSTTEPYILQFSAN